MANRWWEYYFLRYFLGTVAGVVAIVFLTKSPASSLCGFGDWIIGDLAKLGAREITSLAALGFAYCYIASAPMLLMHATRAQVGLTPLRIRWMFWVATTVAIALVHVLIARWLSINWWTIQSASLLVLLSIVGVQVATIIAAHWDRFRAINQFYWMLARARASGASSVAEYVESYRHLREHGNAVSILVLEFGLTFVLFFAPRQTLIVPAIVLWVLPSAYSWLIASMLESRLAHAPRE